MDSSKSPEDSSCCMKEFSCEEVSSWVDQNLDENMGAKFAGEYWPSRTSGSSFATLILSLSSKLLR